MGPCPAPYRRAWTYLDVIGLSNGLLENISTTQKREKHERWRKKVVRT